MRTDNKYDYSVPPDNTQPKHVTSENNQVYHMMLEYYKIHHIHCDYIKYIEGPRQVSASKITSDVCSLLQPNGFRGVFIGGGVPGTRV